MSHRIAFLLPDLRGGGTERLTVDLACGFRQRGFEVDLVLLSKQGEFLDQAPAGSRIIDLSAPRLRHALLPLRRYVVAERPAALVAAMWPLTSIAVLATAGLRKSPRILVSDHCPLTKQYADRPGHLKWSIRATYPFADAVIGVSRGIADEIAGLAGLAASQVAAIANPVPPPPRGTVDPDSLWRGCTGKRLLTMGHLKSEKNQLLLIEAFARMGGQGDAMLAIVGEGAMRPALADRAAALGIAERVLLPGFTATPGDWYAGADLFVLSSDFEGFGNVLIEAMHHGLTVVSTDCPYGPREILMPDRNAQIPWGQLSPPGDADALAAAMANALAAPADPARQRARASEFSLERAVSAYASLAGFDTGNAT